MKFITKRYTHFSNLTSFIYFLFLYDRFSLKPLFPYVKNLTFAAHFAGVTKLADVPDLGSGGAIHVGSSPITRTPHPKSFS